MKTRSEQPSRNRRGVVICGAYGMSNAGDDAVLTAMGRPASPQKASTLGS